MSSSSHDIYETLHGLFAERKSNEVFEIEFVSPELVAGPLLRDGSCIGITKAALAKAFIIARQHFTEALVQRKNAPAQFEKEVVEKGNTNLEIATEIILLFDCEHVTACNWRKSLISAFKRGHAAGQSDLCTLKVLLERERSLLTSFLCSPLHRHTKSPTLWQHRLWIVTELVDLQQSSKTPRRYDNFLCDLAFAELDVVCKAGQLHPRNYYAFSYMRQLHALISRSSLPTVKSGPSETVTNNDALLLELALDMVEPMLKWCLSNPSDISGWMYLFFLLNRDNENDIITSFDGTSLGKNVDFKRKRKLVMDRTIHFAVQIASWEGESLWTFIDLMLTRFGTSVLPARGATDVPQTSSALGKQGNNKPPVARWQATMKSIQNDYGKKQAA